MSDDDSGCAGLGMIIRAVGFIIGAIIGALDAVLIVVIDVQNIASCTTASRGART